MNKQLCLTINGAPDGHHSFLEIDGEHRYLLDGPEMSSDNLNEMFVRARALIEGSRKLPIGQRYDNFLQIIDAANVFLQGKTKGSLTFTQLRMFRTTPAKSASAS